ncbi:MAG TPA: peptide ABC transporter ATP-binding protein, partial [Actinobacteria bacterium]|nr:peptide ABC transporter ATP-binding protein [Actinomycetota bacterium]
GFARQVGDRVTFIDDGVVVEENAPEEILLRPQQERTRKFLEAVQHY